MIVRLFALIIFGWLVFRPYSLPLALANKETALTLPLALVVYDLLHTPRLRLSQLRELVARDAPFFALMSFYFAWRIALLGGLSLPQAPQGTFTLFD